MTFGAFLRETRTCLGLTGTALSQRADCDPGLLSKIEHDKTRPSPALLLRLFTALELIHPRGTTAPQPVFLSAADQALLDAYHALGAEGQAFVFTVLRRESARCQASRGIPVLGAAVDLPAGAAPPDHPEK